jgi:hypothetical protein
MEHWGSAGGKREHQEQRQQEHAERVPADGRPKSFFCHPANVPPIGECWPARLSPGRAQGLATAFPLYVAVRFEGFYQ